MREYGVEVCSEECGRTTWRPAVGRWVCTSAIWPNPGHCEHCGIRVGIDERGPWRERMVPMGALEWLAEWGTEDCPERFEGKCPLSEADTGAPCAENPRDPSIPRKCWIEAALKAAEEDSDGEC